MRNCGIGEEFQGNTKQYPENCSLLIYIYIYIDTHTPHLFVDQTTLAKSENMYN